MSLFFSPWFIGLSILSFITMALELWGLLRACRRHNVSPIGVVCGKGACIPTTGIILAIVAYIFLTILYFILPPIVHSFFS